MKNCLKIALSCTHSLPGDVRGNLKKIEEAAAAASSNGCDYLFTPEMSASGYGGGKEVLACAEYAGRGEIYRALARIAADCRLALSAGFAERAEDKFYISHYTVFPDGQWNVTRKHRVTPSEKPFSPAVPFVGGTDPIGQVRRGEEKFTVFSLNGVRAAIVICADWGMEGLLDRLCALGVRLVLLATAAGGTREERFSLRELKDKKNADLRQKFLRETAKGAFYEMPLECIDRQIAFACCNLAGRDGAFYHCGSLKIVDCRGQVLCSAPDCLLADDFQTVFAFAELRFC